MDILSFSEKSMPYMSKGKKGEEMKSLKSIILLVVLLFLSGVSLSAAEILINETIVTMVKAGISEELIISKIKTSQNQFDLSVESILGLKKKGVTENVIKAMLDASSNIKASPVQSASIDPMAAFLRLGTINSSSLYVNRGDNYIEML